MTQTKIKISPNEKQRECIQTLNGPVMVLAGPGTGKTFTIIQRIKYMIDTGIEPASILCLTYSEAAANEMKSRMVKEIGTSASAVSVNTYHAFCNDIIRQYPAKFELLDGVSLIDDITKRNIMAEAIEEVRPVYFRTRWGDSKYFIPELLKSVDEIKSNRVTKEEYYNVLNTHPLWQGKMEDLRAEYVEREQKGKLVKTFLNTYEAHIKKMGKAEEVWSVFEKYDIKLKQNNFIDFNDMINMVLNIFDEDEEFLKKVSAQYKYFLIDEYQDTNYSQNKIVFSLANGSGSDNIFVVGDDDQVIYEFQGAKVDTLERFLLLYPDTKVICLNENNRSSQNILDFSYRVISQDKSRLENNPKFASYNISKCLTAKNEKVNALNSKIQVHGFGDIRQENNFIVKDIQKIISNPDFPLNSDKEKDLSKIAILARENSELSNFASLLESKNIKYQIKESKNIFEIKSSLLVYFYLKTLLNHEYYSDKLFGLLHSKPFEFDNADYSYLLEQNRINHKDLITNIKLALEEREWSNADKVKSFIKTFDELNSLKNSLNIKDLIITVINKTGILEYFVENDINKSDNIYAIKKIIDEAQSHMYLNKGSWLGSFLTHIDSAFESNIPINIDKDEFTQNAVQLLTLHGSKGREFDYVYIPNLIAKKWEGKRVNNTSSLPINKENLNIDEDSARYSEHLRLLFVGLTRAKHRLCLTYSNSIDAKPQEFTSYLSNTVQNNDLVETCNHELSKDNYLEEIYNSLKKEEYNYTEAFKDELKARVEKIILSQSTMNSYINCPKNFLYSNVLKIPIYDKSAANAHYGSAIHYVLNWAISYAKENEKYPEKELFADEFKMYLSKEKFDSQEERNRYEERGLKCIENYYKQFSQIPYSRIYSTEYSFDYVPSEEYFIKGFIDRIEQNSDGTYEVYDYKTGSVKSKAQIADGKDKENYLNQLRFYKYAFELQNPGRKVSKAGLIFVEDPDMNYYIELTDEDNKLIKEKIDYVYKNIKSLNFNPPEKESRNCEYCDYIHLCKLSEL